MEGYCERHHQPLEIKCVGGQWVYECSKCRAEGLLDLIYDTKVTTKSENELKPNYDTQTSFIVRRR